MTELSWIPSGEALARLMTVSDEALSDILTSGRVGITARLESGPPHRFHALRLKSTPSRIDEIMTLVPGQIEFLPGNRIKAVVAAWSEREMMAAAHQAAAMPGYRISLSADTCVFRDVRMHWPTLLGELAAAGYAADPPPEPATDGTAKLAEREQEAITAPANSASPEPIPEESIAAEPAAAGSVTSGTDEARTSKAKRGRNPGDGTKNDDAALDQMFRLIATGEASSPNAAALRVAKNNQEPAANAYRRLAGKFTKQYGPQLRDGETWGNCCRRIEVEMQSK